MSETEFTPNFTGILESNRWAIAYSWIIVTSVPTDLIHLENELTKTIAKIIELKLFSRKFVEFYLDATNGSFFVYELDENKERTDDSMTVHFCALKIWEDYKDSNEFNSDMKTTLYNSIENLKKRKIEIPFKIILIDELGMKYRRQTSS